jgi:hypothetical protein
MCNYCRCVAYVGVVGYKVRTDEVAPNATEHVDKGSPEPTEALLNMAQDEEREQQRQHQMNQPVHVHRY